MKLFTAIICAAWLLLHASETNAAATLKGAAKQQPRLQVGRILKSSRVKKPDYRECSISESKDKVRVTCKATNAPETEKEEEKSKDDDSDDEQSNSTDTTTSGGGGSTRGIVLAPAIEIRDKIKYTVESDKKGVEVKVEYEQEFEEMDGSAEGETSTSFKIVFDSIVEYAKSNTNTATTTTLMDDNATTMMMFPQDQAYDWNEDEVVQTMELKDWADLSTVESDGVVSHFFASSEDRVVAFNFSISRAEQGEKLTANTMKIDVHIVRFPWMRNDTFLSLTSTVSSKMDVDVKHDDKASVLLPQDDVQIPFASAVDTIGFVPFGSYKWDSSAEAVESDATEEQDEDNVVLANVEPETLAIGKSTNAYEFVILEKLSSTIQVIASSPRDYGNETTQLIAYSFVGSAAQNASYIYWDPEAGIGYEETDQEEYVIGENGERLNTPSSAPAAFGVGMGLVVAALGHLLLVMA